MIKMNLYFFIFNIVANLKGLQVLKHVPRNSLVKRNKSNIGYKT